MTAYAANNELNGHDGASWLKGGVGDSLLFMSFNDGDAGRAIYDASGFGNDTLVQF